MLQERRNQQTTSISVIYKRCGKERNQSPTTTTASEKSKSGFSTLNLSSSSSSCCSISSFNFMEVNWSELPSDLVEFIAKKLTLYLDYVRFRAVCVKWNSSTSPTPHHLPTQLPWLMLPFSPHNGTRRAFFNPSENKFHRLNLPETRHRRCCGSSLGWVVLVEEHSPELILLNPLTRRIQTHLPPLTSFPNVLDFNIYKLGREYLIQDSFGGERRTLSLKEMRDGFIKKVVLSSIDNSCIVVVILEETGDLAFCKKGVEEWILIEDAHSYCEDVIYSNGFFYAVNKKGSIAVCDLSGISPVVTLITPPPLLIQPLFIGFDMVYLVDSFGELLLVIRYLGHNFDREYDLAFQTYRFDVIKLDTTGMEWVEMESLGDRMLFLGGNSSVCLSASEFSGCEGNRIYFTYDYLNEAECNGPNGGNARPDLGVFNLEDGSIQPLPYNEGTSQQFMPPPIWVTPNPS